MWLIPALLIAANLAVFSQLSTHDFVALDDDAYVSENPMVQGGFSWPAVKWAFTTFANANWHPLTWLSHMADCEVYGLNSGRHLMTNLGLHILASLFLFLALKDMTGQPWPSGAVAALFAVHPLHVESVAWVAERKDVLSGFFCMLTLWMYARYVRDPGSRKKYAAVLISFALGLLAKPMLVTLPFLLLLLDYWPLNRLNRDAVREKAPLLAMSAASIIVTIVAQAKGGAVQPLAAYPFGTRLCNAVLSYALYLRKTLWPSGLAVYYPFSPIPPQWALAIAIPLGLVTAGLVALRRKHPWLLASWLWYGGSLVPVIGIVQVGEQAMADRYTYIPLVGIFIAVVWETAAAVSLRPDWKKTVAVATAVVIAALGWAARVQAGWWKNSTVLFERALAVTADNAVIENNLGIVLFKEGNPEEAFRRFSNAVRIKPDYAMAYMNLGMVFAARGELDKALDRYDEALRHDPENSTVHLNRGVSLLQLNRLEEALLSFELAIRCNPEDAAGQTNAGIVLIRLRRPREATPHFREAVRLDRGNAEAHNNLGQALAGEGNYIEAEQEFREAVRLNPSFQPAQDNLLRIRQFTGQ